MKYWSYFVVKLALAAALVAAVWQAMHAVWPEPEPFMRVKLDPFGTDLAYTFAILFLGLFAVALGYLAVLDQRYRCRTCLRRLRMPVSRGSWQGVLLGPPRTEYICPYGHGTLRVKDLHLESPEATNWRQIDDIWKELERMEETPK